MITMRSIGNFKKTFGFLERAKEVIHLGNLDKFGREGVEALIEHTPIDTGITAASWYYEIDRKPGSVSIIFKNSNIVDGNNIAILLQYGHGTGTGGYVVGRDYINPAIQPIFDRIANDAWKEVVK